MTDARVKRKIFKIHLSIQHSSVAMARYHHKNNKPNGSNTTNLYIVLTN